MKKKILSFCCFIFIYSFSISQTTNNCEIINAGFELGNTFGWISKSGGYGLNNPCPIDVCTRYGTVYTGGGVNGGMDSDVTVPTNRHTIMSTSYGNDPNTDPLFPVPVVAPGGGNYSFRLGNANASINGNNGNPRLAQAEAIRLTFLVTKQNASFIYRYSFFVSDGGTSHSYAAQPSFEVVVLDKDDILIPCGRNIVTAGDFPNCVNTNGFIKGINNFIYKPWTDVGLDLSGYIGQNVSVEFRTTDCFPRSSCWQTEYQ
jgi:hypothetical protein